MLIVCAFLCIACGQRARQPSGAGLIITPGVGAGDIKFGMTREKVIKILGKPEREQFKNCLEYRSLGIIALGLQFDPEGGVVMLLFGDPDPKSSADSPLVKACKYRTAEGIGMGSTLEQVEKVYGKGSVGAHDGIVTVNYGTDLSKPVLALKDNRVIYMIFMSSEATTERAKHGKFTEIH